MLLERHGYEDASEYPLWYLQEQSARLIKHLNNDLRQHAIMTNLAVGATKSKKGSQAFQKTLEKM
jgi:hypothetical protein